MKKWHQDPYTTYYCVNTKGQKKHYAVDVENNHMYLPYRGRDKMAYILQTNSWNTFLWQKFCVFCIKNFLRFNLKVLMVNSSALVQITFWRFWNNNNITRPKAHTIVSCPEPIQGLMNHISDLIMIIRRSTNILKIIKREAVSWIAQPIYCAKVTDRIFINLRHTLDRVYALR